MHEYATAAMGTSHGNRCAWSLHAAEKATCASLQITQLGTARLS